MLRKRCQEKWEDVYLTVKNVRASKALKWTLDPGWHVLTLLTLCNSALSANSWDKISWPPPVLPVLDLLLVSGLNDGLVRHIAIPHSPISSSLHTLKVPQSLTSPEIMPHTLLSPLISCSCCLIDLQTPISMVSVGAAYAVRFVCSLNWLRSSSCLWVLVSLVLLLVGFWDCVSISAVAHGPFRTTVASCSCKQLNDVELEGYQDNVSMFCEKSVLLSQCTYEALLRIPPSAFLWVASYYYNIQRKLHWRPSKVRMLISSAEVRQKTIELNWVYFWTFHQIGNSNLLYKYCGLQPPEGTNCPQIRLTKSLTQGSVHIYTNLHATTALRHVKHLIWK